MALKPLTYRVGGAAFTGLVADGSRGRPDPDVLVTHEGGGYLTNRPQERAVRLADLGYVAFALNLLGDLPPTLEQSREIVQQLRSDLPMLRTRVAAALEQLKQQPNVAAGRISAIQGEQLLGRDSCT
jgi:dienelactone hydrolase